MPPPPSLITLLTDFGDRDYFVASMKGVILSISPDAGIVDLSHHINPYHIQEAAYLLRACYRYFPPGTVHTAVVDPGVGSARRPLLMCTSQYYFIAPDNGLLSYVMDDTDPVEIRQIENPKYRLTSEGATFHGRDIFAPAAAWLVRGQPLASFGPPIRDPIRLDVEKPAWDKDRLAGRIMYVDRFGNLLSNITAKQVDDVRFLRGGFRIEIAEAVIEALVVSYSDGTPGKPAALINSNGVLEIFVREGNAAAMLGCGVGTTVRLG